MNNAVRRTALYGAAAGRPAPDLGPSVVEAALGDRLLPALSLPTSVAKTAPPNAGT